MNIKTNTVPPQKRTKEETNILRTKSDRLCLAFRNATNHRQRQRAMDALKRLERNGQRETR